MPLKSTLVTFFNRFESIIRLYCIADGIFFVASEIDCFFNSSCSVALSVNNVSNIGVVACWLYLLCVVVF